MPRTSLGSNWTTWPLEDGLMHRGLVEIEDTLPGQDFLWGMYPCKKGRASLIHASESGRILEW